MKNTWISEAEAMGMMGFTNKIAFRKAAREKKIGFTKPHYRSYLYSKESIDRYLNKNSSIAA